MDEARRVIERLERIDVLRASRADPAALLDELRGLLRDGEAWALAEGVSARRAREALAGLEAALGPGGLPVAEPVRRTHERKEVGIRTTSV